MTDACRRFHGIGEIFFLEFKGHIDQADEHRHLHQGAYYSGKGLAGIDTEYGHAGATANSKLLDVTVKESVAGFRQTLYQPSLMIIFLLFQLYLAKLAISAAASSVGPKQEMNLIAVGYFSCQTFCTDAHLVDQHLDMRIKRP